MLKSAEWTQTLVVPDASTLVGGVAELTTFADDMKYVAIQLDPDCGKKLLVCWNAAAPAEAGAAGTIVQVCYPGPILENPPGLIVRRIALYCANALVWETEYWIMGYPR